MTMRPRTARRAQSRQEDRLHARERQRIREIRTQRIRFGLIIGAVVLVVALIGAGMYFGSRGQPGKSVPIQGAQHIQKGEQHAAYNSKPPTSGPHWNIGGEAPVPWGIYTEPIPDEAQLHNLEHGGVMIHYSCRDCPELATRLEDFYNRYVPANRLPMFPTSSKIVIAPYYDMDARIALTAWGRIDTFDDYDEQRIVRFLEAFRDKGAPEAGRVP